MSLTPLIPADDALGRAQILALKKILDAEKDADYRKRLQTRIDELEKDGAKTCAF